MPRGTSSVSHLMRLARKAGWTVEQYNHGGSERGSAKGSRTNPHWKWVTPDGRLVMTTSHTPGSQNLGRIRSCLRREGILS